jgi:hypothetical protein
MNIGKYRMIQNYFNIKSHQEQHLIMEIKFVEKNL